MSQHYLHGSLTERFEIDPEFRAAETRVRELEKTVNMLAPEVEELENRVSALEQQGCDRGVVRLKFELNQAQQKLSQARVDLQQASAARDALLS